MLPNFLVIGPGKSGTTWIYHALKDHPQICVSSAKETLFFETEFNRGIEWYSGFFSHCNEGVKAMGEVSNTYIFCSQVPERIKSVNPEMKLISCLRNPIERTFSHYLFLIRGGQFQGTFREALEQRSHLIEKGKYFKNLKPYFDTFTDKQICIKLFDELKDNQEKFIQAIYEFLGVDSHYQPVVDDEKRLSAARPRNKYLALIAKKGARLMRTLGYPEIVSRVKYSSLPQLLYKEYGKDNKPTINDEDREFLKEQLLPDTRKLGEKLNLNLEKIWYE